jgi:hypothetical protein
VTAPVLGGRLLVHILDIRIAELPRSSPTIEVRTYRSTIRHEDATCR